ncbi:MAG: PASTA domain-containing protein [Bacteroidetes bacterium]|nr:MAG: PASTA domain-containing protein [Bacteroidota bacterium]
MEEENNIENFEEEFQNSKKRLYKFWLILLFISIGFIAVIVRLFIIQIIDADKYQLQAKRQHEAKVPLRAERGNIYDRNGNLVAGTVMGVSLAADPTILKEKEKLCSILEKSVGLNSIELLNKIKSTDGAFVWLARGLIPDDLIGIDSIKLNGFIKYIEPRRNYLYSPIASQIIGCTDVDNKGLSGIELSFDTLLSGKSGYMIMQRDATGHIHPTANLPVIEALHGKSIIITIDIELQRIIEYELKKGMERTNSLSGTVIALEPSSGEILGMASYPSYDQNDLKNVQAMAMKNKAITDLYEPGSTFKTITASAAIDKNIITPTKMCNGHLGLLDYGKYQIKDDHPIGIVSFADALAYSSNVIFSQVGNSIPDADFASYLSNFGFGKRWGVELSGEPAGRIKKAEELTPASKRFMSFGYGISVTPLQMITAYSAIANRGVLMKPHIVKATIDNNGDTTFNNPKTIRRVISENSADTITKMLIGVVEKGTGKSAQIEGYKVAGKTGTTQKLVNGSYATQSYYASFIGFFPADRPKIALLVLLDSPQGSYYGGAVAAPIFRDILIDWLAVNPITASEKVNGSKSRFDSVFVPDLRGLYVRDVLKIVQNLKLKLQNVFDTNSVIISQNPKPTSKIKLWGKIDIVVFDKSKKAELTDVRGLTLRRAITILNNSGIKSRVIGTGKVSEQLWSGRKSCTLICK